VIDDEDPTVIVAVDYLESMLADTPRQLVLQAGPVASPAYMTKIVEAARIERQRRLGPNAPK
jgi:hypothetical protein